MIDRKYKPDQIDWTVALADGGEPEGITVSNKGQLSADKKLEKVQDVVVRAASPVFGTSAEYAVTVIPAVTGFSTEPAELTFYAGTESSITVKAVLEPDTVPPAGLVWKVSKEGIVEVVPGGDGTAEVKPAAAGSANITVTEPGGKKATVKAAVVEPVTDVELTVSGKPKPGSTVTVKAALVPAKAGKKDLEWSLDVGEDVATVSNGKVKIGKDAPSGTVITVTCTATGAPEPVVRTVQITVE